MRKTLNKTILSLLITTLFLLGQITPVLAQDLQITYESEPLFDEDDIKPCDVITKTTTVTNTSTTATYEFGIAMFDELDPDGLAGILEIRIYDQNGNNLYGGVTNPKVLADIYAETQFSDNPTTPGTEVYLLTIAPGATYTISMEIIFPCESGNIWQATSTEFSFGMGWTGSVLGEETKKEEGKILSATGQSILAGLAIGAGLIFVARKAIFKKKKFILVKKESD